VGRRGNGEGSISRRKDGRWEAKYTAHTAEGPKRRALYGKTRKEAADKLAKALADRASGYTFDTENITVGEYLDRWLEDSDRGSVRPSTYERHEQIVRLHLKPALGRVKLSKLTPAHVQGLYRDKLDSGLSPATVQKIHTVLHKALTQALKWNMIARNAADAVKAPRPAPEEMHPLSPDEARKLIEAVRNDKLEALYVLGVHTGMRQGELLALKWEDVDLNEGVIRIRRTLVRSGGRISLGEPKTKGSRRTVYLTGCGGVANPPGAAARRHRATGRSLPRPRPRLHLGGWHPHQPLEPAQKVVRAAASDSRASADTLPRPAPHLCDAATEP
jgi:integrase